MAYRYDDSYPFMHLAQRYGADYGDVLVAADLLEKAGAVPEHKLRAYRRVIAHEGLMHALMGLVAQPVAERGGRHEVPEVTA